MKRIKKILLEDEAVTANYKNASDFKYMKSLRFNLNILNAWPGNKIEGNQSKYQILINFGVFLTSLICLCGSLHYMKINWNILSFYELGHMYIVLLMTVVEMSRIFLTLPQSTKYMNVGEVFLTKMHLIYFKDVSEYAKKTYRKINKISELYSLFLTVQMFVGMILFNVIPMWTNYSSGKFKERILHNSTYEHALYLSLPPLKIYTHIDAYVFAALLYCFMSYACSIAFCMLDLLLSLMIFNLWGHFKILLHDLKTFPLPSTEVVSTMNASVFTKMYSEEESKIIFQKLKQCIDYHRLISDFTDNISAAFGPMLFVYYVFHQVSGCLLLFECSQMTAEALMRYLPLSVILFQQLIQLSVIFELIGSTSEKLKDAVYGVPWQYMDTKNRRIVTIFLYYVQEPIHVKALGVINVGVTTMATILKTSLSYFTVLRSM
uniref:Odorant receptor n=1 Tax=Mythimna loreyi TaxID=667449 RepID=A0AAU6ND99_9NEOP